MITAMLSRCLTMFGRQEQSWSETKLHDLIVFIITEGCWALAKYCELQCGKQAVVMIWDQFTFFHVSWAWLHENKHSALVIVIVLFFKGEHFREPNISISHA